MARGGLCSRAWRQICAWRNFFILLGTPIAACPILLIGNSESKCAYSVVLMAMFWFTEAMPVGMTALLPVVLFPLLDIVKSSDISRLYMTDTNMMLFGSMLVAVSIEYWDIHKRIALRILMVVGSEPRWLMLGLMIATWFLSMWISNMATAAMMIPITEAVLQQLEECNSPKRQRYLDFSDDESTSGNGFYGVTPPSDTDNETVETPLQEKSVTHPFALANAASNNIAIGDLDLMVKNGDAGHDKDIEKGDDSYKKSTSDDYFKGLCKGMSLCICYAANIGGVATLTGTGPNLIMKGNSDRMYNKVDETNPINFGTWMAFGLPLSLLLLIICWLWLQLAFFARGMCRCRKGSSQDDSTSKRIKDMIAGEYRKLGPIVFGQAVVIVLFIFLVALWITRDMGGVAGWGKHFKGVSNTMPGILIGILMFVLPSTLPCLPSYKHYAHPDKKNKQDEEDMNQVVIRPLMTWEYLNRKMPWQLVLLLGGGFALSEGFVKSGLSAWIGDQLYFFRNWNEWLVLIIFCYITAAATEIASNNAITSVLLPIMSELALRIGANPLLFIIPVTLSCSFAFMLPVATPTNAIVFTYGRLRTLDMAKAGFIMNVISVPCTVFLTKTLGFAIFDLGDAPTALFGNGTLTGTP